MGVYMRVMKTQSDRVQSILERMASGEYKADDWVGDVTQFWSNLVFDGISAFESLQQSAAGDTVPTCVLILDDPAEGGDPKSLPLAVRLNEDDRVATTSFSRIDRVGEGGIAADRFRMELDPMRNRLLVTPIDIGSIDSGHYLGWVYVRKPGPKLPIAAIHLIKLESELPTDQPGGGSAPKKVTRKKAARRKKTRKPRRG
jgi:hypothetical protein